MEISFRYLFIRLMSDKYVVGLILSMAYAGLKLGFLIYEATGSEHPSGMPVAISNLIDLVTLGFVAKYCHCRHKQNDVILNENDEKEVDSLRTTSLFMCLLSLIVSAIICFGTSPMYDGSRPLYILTLANVNAVFAILGFLFLCLILLSLRQTKNMCCQSDYQIIAEPVDYYPSAEGDSHV
jgi:hypothetical protein